MTAVANESTRNFNQRRRVVEGWYWTLRSSELKRGKTRAVNLMGQELALYRGDDGKVVALDAYCPHMGAHLAEGRVEGAGLRCFFHHWRYEADGRVSNVPCQPDAPLPKVSVRSWPVEERYGLVWIHTGPTPRHPVPVVPELAGLEVDAMLGNAFIKNCHPNVMMINAIDAQHFYSVHDIPNMLRMERTVVSDACIAFANAERMPGRNWLGRLLSRFYRGVLTYALTYWYGSTGTVTLGPDFFHFYIMFALRQGDGGNTEGQTVLLTRKRRGPLGWLFNRGVLIATKLVGDYFARGDTRVFQTIRFDFQTPIRSDRAILDFIQHYERQRPARWGFSQPSEAEVEAAPAQEALS